MFARGAAFFAALCIAFAAASAHALMISEVQFDPNAFAPDAGDEFIELDELDPLKQRIGEFSGLEMVALSTDHLALSAEAGQAEQPGADRPGQPGNSQMEARRRSKRSAWAPQGVTQA